MRRIDTAAPALKAADDGEQTDAVTSQLLEEAIQKNEKLAESGIEMARLFIQNGKKAVAKRRLQQIVKEFGQAAAAKEAKSLLSKL